ncbi:MAG: hypothetical protein HY882_09300 [Deltaproteobacteria bacterium]|nr:hypothetical protein [Deltaproteobacteria bacterium]
MRFTAGSKNGFALIAAILVNWVLMSVGLLVFAISTQDVRISSRLVGEKKAFSAVEGGIHQFIRSFNPADLPSSAVSNVAIDPSHDPASRYTIGTPSRPTTGPATVPLFGYAIAGGQQWGQEIFDVEVTGANTRYNSMTRVSLGAGYGPVEITTAYR